MLQGLELIDWRNKDEVIGFYESNKLYFDNYKVQTQPDSILDMIDFKLTYCDALISEKHYTDCLDILTHINILVNKLDKVQISGYNSRYERYLFTEGMVLGRLKRYEESQNNFKELVRIDPKNDLYKDWYVSNKTNIIAKQSNIVGYTGCGIIILDLILDILFNIRLSKYVSLIGVVVMVLGFTYPYLLRKFSQMMKSL